MSTSPFFVKALIFGEKDQARALLFTINKSQTNLISEISHNLASRYKDNKKSILFKIGDPDYSWSKRKKIIQKHMRTLLIILQNNKKELLERYE